MPQMAPMNWLTLFIFFTIVFLLFNMMNFFLINYQINKKTTNMKKTKLNWKW